MFKVGDWVRQKRTGTIAKIQTSDYKNRKVLVYHKATEYLKQQTEHTHELWQPKEGEWCFYPADYGAGLIRYDGKGDISLYEPFIGELPSFVKENNDV